MKLLPLNGKLAAGRSAKVDDDVFEWASQLSWSLTPDGYAKAWLPEKSKQVYLHREIAASRSLGYVDHKNGDTLDYTRENLRPCTMSQNQMNSRKRPGTSSQYKGVSWNKHLRKWKCSLRLNGRNFFIGYFANERHAAIAYDLNAPALFGEFFRGNFISAGQAGSLFYAPASGLQSEVPRTA